MGGALYAFLRGRNVEDQSRVRLSAEEVPLVA